MTAFVFYLVKVIVCSALFAGSYWWTLRNRGFYHWNRFYIVASVMMSIMIPLLNISIPAMNHMIPAATGLGANIGIDPSEELAAHTQAHTRFITGAWLGWTCSMFIILFLLMKEIISFVRILRLKRCSERIRIPETVLYCTDDASAPFTFFRTIFWKKGISVDSGEGRCMLRHELAHARLGHSWDKALMQLVCCLFWMNPFFMLFRRELELVHEFAADSESNAEELSSLILCTLYPKHYHDFTSRFFQSTIKRRIFMITKNKNKKSSLNVLRKMSIVPVALVAMYLFACNSVSSSADSGEIQTNDEMVASAGAVTDQKEGGASNSDADLFLFAVVDVKPTFNGTDAEKGFREYISSNAQYPIEAQTNGITGRVIVEFTIDMDGSVCDARLMREVDPLLDNEALRVINASPKWTPGKHDGKTVKVKYQFPIYFQLNN